MTWARRARADEFAEPGQRHTDLLAIGEDRAVAATALEAGPRQSQIGPTDALKQAISGATPEQMLALKKADQDFALQMQALGFKEITDLEAIAAGDRDSARKMQAAAPSRIPALLTCFVVGAFTATLILLLKFDVPTTNRDIVVYMIGQLSGGFTSALAFWLGTTRESGRKTELLAQAAPVASST